MNDHEPADSETTQATLTTSRQGHFDMPENHLDVVVTPGSVDPSRKASLRTTLIAVISMPLFFLLAFTLCYVSATHAPAPNDMAVTLVANASTAEELSTAIDEEAPGAFDLSRSPSEDDATNAVEQRDAVGAIIIDGTDVTTVIASGGGRLAASAVTNLGDRIAAEIGSSSPPTIEEVAALPSDDPGGSTLFFLLVICTVGAFLSVSGVAQAFPGARLRTMVATAAGAALLVPVLGFSMISVYVDYEAPFGTVAAVIGIGMIYSFTVGLIASFLTATLGSASIFAVILVLIAFNFPSAGSSAPASMLPAFWQLVHDGWIGAGAFEAMRSVLFFDGHQSGSWLFQLSLWLVGAVLLLVAVTVTRRRRIAREESSTDAQTGSGGDLDSTTQTAPRSRRRGRTPAPLPQS